MAHHGNSSELVESLEQWIREGKFGAVRETLAKTAGGRPPRAVRWRLAQLAWRVDLPELGLKLLARLVHPTHRAPVQATAEEKSEYAACLIRYGAVDEAKLLLDEMAGETLPLVFLYRAFVHIAQWGYGAAIGPLTSYVRSEALSDYQRLVGRVNLAAALVYERRNSEAGPLLEELRETTAERGHLLLFGNVLEITAQSFLDTRRWSEAARFLGEAKTALADAGSSDRFFVEKWGAYLEFARTGGRDVGRRLLASLRDKASAGKLHETVRQCDRIEAVVAGDREIGLRVFFGTPYADYRRRLLSDFPALNPPDSYEWRHRPGHHARIIHRLDIRAGTLTPGKSALKEGQAVHRLLQALAADRYRPRRLAALHASTYPGEKYRPFSSPGKVFNVLFRLRQWLASTGRGEPYRALARRGLYELNQRPHAALTLANPERASQRLSRDLERLRAAVSDSEFATGDACRALGLPRRTVQRMLACETQKGELTRIGPNGSARYKFANEK